MPTYVYRCGNGHQSEVTCSVRNHDSAVSCPSCHLVAQQVITAPLLVTCAPNVCYDSPVDGTPITSWQQRREDLKRHGCIPYDPEMKTDATRRLKEQEAALDQSVDEHVERTIEKMSTAKRGQLYSELTEQGKTAEPVRLTKTA